MPTTITAAELLKACEGHDGYINASAICSLCGKEPTDYLDSNERFLRLVGDMGIVASPVAWYHLPTHTELWISAALFSHFAAWVSPELSAFFHKLHMAKAAGAYVNQEQAEAMLQTIIDAAAEME